MKILTALFLVGLISCSVKDSEVKELSNHLSRTSIKRDSVLGYALYTLYDRLPPNNKQFIFFGNPRLEHIVWTLEHQFLNDSLVGIELSVIRHNERNADVDVRNTFIYLTKLYTAKYGPPFKETDSNVKWTDENILIRMYHHKNEDNKWERLSIDYKDIYAEIRESKLLKARNLRTDNHYKYSVDYLKQKEDIEIKETVRVNNF